jgi:hypothetical protein
MIVAYAWEQSLMESKSLRAQAGSACASMWPLGWEYRVHAARLSA